MKKCALNISSLKSVRLMSRLVSSLAFFNSTSVKPPEPNTSGADNSAAKRAALSGSGTNRLRGRCGRLLSNACILSFNMPGTSHSARSSLTWFNTNKGTVTVTPSLASPGACRYCAAQSTPPKRTIFGNACAVIPTASCRISDSRVINKGSLLSPASRLRRISSRCQRSKPLQLQTSSGNNCS